MVKRGLLLTFTIGLFLISIMSVFAYQVYQENPDQSSCSNSASWVYVNYTKLPNSASSTIWTSLKSIPLVYGTPTYNNVTFTGFPACWNADPNKIILRIFYGVGGFEQDCWNGTSWKSMLSQGFGSAQENHANGDCNSLIDGNWNTGASWASDLNGWEIAESGEGVFYEEGIWWDMPCTPSCDGRECGMDSCNVSTCGNYAGDCNDLVTGKSCSNNICIPNGQSHSGKVTYYGEPSQTTPTTTNDNGMVQQTELQAFNGSVLNQPTNFKPKSAGIQAFFENIINWFKNLF